VGRKKKIAAQIDRLTAKTNSVTRHRVLEVAEVLSRVQDTANDALTLATRAFNETGALAAKHTLHDEHITRFNEALAALNKEQEVLRLTRGLIDADVVQILADIKELRADIVRLSEVVGSDNTDLQTLGAKVRSMRSAPASVASLNTLAPGPDATVTNIFHGGVDVPIPTYTTPSEVCRPEPIHIEPIGVSIGALIPDNFDWTEAREAFEAILDRAPWPRDEGAFEYETVANGYRITLIHTQGEPLTDMDIHDTLWKIIGGWKKEN
jgi:hypothetical protein